MMVKLSKFDLAAIIDALVIAEREYDSQFSKDSDEWNWEAADSAARKGALISEVKRRMLIYQKHLYDTQLKNGSL